VAFLQGQNCGRIKGRSPLSDTEVERTMKEVDAIAERTAESVRLVRLIGLIAIAVLGGLVVVLYFSMSGPPTEASMRQNIGKVACNARTGGYRGRVVDVETYAARGQGSMPVYVIEQNGRRQSAAANIVSFTGPCLQ
jgi:hypothetical protein